MSALKDHITLLRTWARKHTEASFGKEGAPAPTELINTHTDIGEDAAEIGRKILSAAMADRCAYEPTPDSGFQIHPETLGDVLKSPKATNSDGASLYNLDTPQVQYMLEAITPYSTALRERSAHYGLGVASHKLQSSIYPQTPLSRFGDKAKKDMGLDGQLLFRKLWAELETARYKPDRYNTNTPMVQKIQRGVQVYADGRIADALTILKNARNEDPHNKLTSYVLSNVFYHRAAHGHRKYLPQAREEAKKAATRIDKIGCQITDRFGYNYIALDGYFGPDRQLEILRDFGAITPPDVDASEEAHACYIKCMAFFSLTKSEDWTEKDIAYIRQMALEYVGGGLLFTLFYEKKCLPHIFSDNSDIATHFDPLREVMLILRGVQHNLNEYRLALSEYFAENIEMSPPKYWTINRRLLRTAAKGMPTPDIDMFLANTSLNGKHHTATESLNLALRESGLQVGDFWSLWISKLNYSAKYYSPKALPHKLAIEEAEILPKAVLALEDLRRAEARLIDQERWSLSSHYQPKYTYENLAELGLGHSFTSVSFAPKNESLKNHYKIWGAVLPTGLLPSEIIEARAKAGGFADVAEIATALDGAQKILKEPEYGLIANQNKAWKIYLEMQDRVEKNGDGGFKELMAEVWWFILVIPVAILAFMLVASSNSIASGARTFSIILIALVILGCGITIAHRSGQIKQRRAARRPEAKPPSDHDDEEGEDMSLQDLAGK